MISQSVSEPMWLNALGFCLQFYASVCALETFVPVVSADVVSCGLEVLQPACKFPTEMEHLRALFCFLKLNGFSLTQTD